MRRPLYIIGTAGLAREMAQLAAQAGAWELEGFIGAGWDEVGRDLGWGRVVGDDAWLLESGRKVDIIVGIGHPQVRAAAISRYVSDGGRFTFPNVVHPAAQLDIRWVTLGQGNAVTAGCVLTTDIRLGDFNLLNWLTTVGHDASAGDSNVFNPSVSISGGVAIGNRVLVGTGARILEGLTVGSDATVGAGAVVTRPVSSGMTVVGVPARPLEPRMGP
jgi:sugar O-acyltransferase (sialic acid O-acetyltransferase NeuD family)